MKKLAKFVLWWLFGLFTFALVAPTFNTAEAQSTPFTQWGLGTTAGIGVAWAWTSTASNSLITIIKNAINRWLWILWLIVLVLLLRGGFQMVTAAGDETKYKAWFKILKQAAIGLAFIAISFFVVSIIFWLLWSLTGGAAEDTWTQISNILFNALA